MSLILSSSAGAFAETAPAAVQDQTTLYLSASEDCGDEETLEELKSELRLRMPEVELLVGDDEPSSRWQLSWQVDEEKRCWIHFSGNESPSIMRLDRVASVEELRMVASRVAWLASVEDASIDERLNAQEAESDEEDLEPLSNEESVDEDETRDEGEDDVLRSSALVETPELVEEVSPASREVSTFTPQTTPVELKISALPMFFFPDDLGPNPVPKLSFNLIAGRSYGLRGMEFGLLYNGQENFAQGLQMGVGINHVGGDVEAVQLAGIANVNEGNLRGINFAGVFNMTGGAAYGAQIAGTLNIARDGLRGAQISGLANIAGSGRGGQLSPFNVAQSWRGAQVGFLNFARDVHGAQIGIFNVGRDTTVSAGLVNFSRGNMLSLGLLNVHYGEPAHMQVWYTINGLTFGGIRHGGRYLQYTYALGYGSAEGEATGVIATGAGLGTHFDFERIYMDIDLLGFFLWPLTANQAQESILNQLRVTMGWKVFRRFAVFGSGAISLLGPWNESLEAVVPGWAGRFSDEQGREIWIWPELQFGVRF